MKIQNYNPSSKKALALWLRLVCVFILSTLAVFETKATLLVNPAAEGGFENGPLFTDNGWTVVNGGANQWYVGTAPAILPPGYNGNVAFISNDGGVSNSYSNTSTSVVHLYRDVTIPAGETNITLSFSWSSVGENDWDMLLVSVAPTSTLPAALSVYPGSGVANNGIPTSRILGAFQSTGSKGTATMTIPVATLLSAGVNTCSGSATFRLIFTWKGDDLFGSNPPAAIDDISLVSALSTLPSPSLSPFTINNTLPSGGTNFNNFTDAINYTNAVAACGFANPLVFNVSSGQIFSENPPALIASGTAANRIIFQKSGALANPEIRPPGTFGSTDFGIGISGGDFITFDGININSSTSFDVEFGYLIRNASSSNGAKSNIIKNCKITLNRGNFNLNCGILQSSSTSAGGGVSAASALGANSDNQYLDIQITNCQAGVYLLGGTTARDFNNVVGTALCTSFNLIGDPANLFDIGNSSNQPWGIRATAQEAVKIFNNKVSSVVYNPGFGSTTPVDGIFIDNSGTASYTLGTYEVHDNIVSGIQTINNSTTSTSVNAAVFGIRINSTANATTVGRIYNNLVYNLNSSAATVPPSRKIIGIFAQPAGSGAGSEMDIDHNTVVLSPANLTISNTCFETGTITGPKFLIRNNNFTNFTASQSVGKHYCFVTPGASAIGNTGSVSDFNNLYVTNSGAGTGNGFVGLSNGSVIASTVDRQELATGANFWQQVTPGLDANSVSADPIYFNTASANFRVISGSLTSAVVNANNGADATWNTKDLDCNLRSALSPHDFGAYAYLGPNVDLAVNSLIRPSISSCHGIAEPVVIRIQNFGVNTINFASNPATVSVLVGGTGSGTISTIVNTGTLAPGGTLDVTVGTRNTSVSGPYSFASSVSDALALDGIPANNNRSDNVNIQALAVSIVGTATICNGQFASLSAVPANHAAPVNYTWSPATGLSATTGVSVVASPLSTTSYTVTANDACLSSAVSPAFTLNVNPKPIISVTPTAALICGSEDATKSPANYSLVASGNSTSYSWSPSSGLSAATGATVTASPYSTTSYVVTGTIAATGCTNSATSVITVGPKLLLTPTATPADVCAGGTSQLNVTAGSQQTVYAVASIPYSPTLIGLSAGTVDGDVTFAGPAGDDAVQGPNNLGFTFNFFGINYNTFGISTNGNIQLGNGSGTVNNPFYSNYWVPDFIPSSSNANAYIGLPWSDYNTGYPGGPNNNITWGVRGTAPNRQLVVSYNNVGSYPGGSNAQVTTEVILYETTNVVEVHVLSYSNGTTSFGNTKTIGIENAAGTLGYAAPGREQFSGEITVPEAWRFTPSLAAIPAVPPVVSWSPNTYLSATNIVNPVASAVNSTVNYTVSATSPEGCVATAPLQLRSGTLSANISSDDAVSCQGQTVTLTANVTNGAGPFGYLWSPGGQTTKSITISPNTVGANAYSVVVTGPCPGGGATTTANFVQTVELTPTLNLNSGYSTMCFPSVTPISLTASGNGASYAWSPATGLNATTGANVQVSSLSNSVNYTVVSTLGNCSATKTSYVKVPGPLYVDATANPDAICLGTTSLLNAATATTASYTADIETVSLISESGTVTTLNNTTPVTAGNFNNGYWQVALPFRASFFDQGYNNIYIGTNGYVSFPQGYTVSAPTEIPSATSPNGAIFLAWKDWNLTTSGSVKYFTSGTAPNRVFVIKYVNVPPVSGSGLLNGQIELYENGSVYLVLISTDGVSTKTVGIESADGSNFRSFSSFNGIPWTISTPQLLRMRADGGLFNYAWSPSLGVFDAFAQSTETVNLSTLPANYSVLVTDSSGCTKSDAVTIIEGTEMNVVINTPDVTPCINESITLSVQIFGGGAPYTFQWEDNNGLLPFTTQSITVTPPLGANTYFVTVNDACTGIPAEGSILITTNPLPTLTVTPSLAATAGGGVACGTDSVSLVASGSSLSYVWSPATNLNKTSGSTVKSRPATFNVPITYTVTGTDANQCSKSVSIPVLRAFSVALTASATPSAVCTGGNSQLLAIASLNATNYDVNSIDFNSKYSGSLSNSVFALGDEGDETINLPFSFNFYGVAFTAVTVHSNGQVLMGANRFEADFVYEPPFPGIPSANSPNNWFGYWSDLMQADDGSSTSGITWDIIGSAPNRKLVIRFTNVNYYFEEPNNTFQYELSETTNTMDIFMTDNSTGSNLFREIGIENGNGTVGLAAPGRNYGTWETSNEAWRFEIPTGGLTYLWTPSTFLTSTTIKNPVAQNVTSSQAYSVTVTSADGCKATAATPVTRSALSVTSVTAADLTVCQDTLIRLTANVVGGGQPYTYVWREDGVTVGTNSSTLEIPAGSAVTHNYSVTVTDICGSPAASNFVDITVIARPNVAVTSSNDICETGSAVLTATGATSYSWSPENGTLSAYTGSTVTSAPTFTTAYNVVGVSSVTGCAATATITQFVHLLPVADPTATPNPILLNANTQLNAMASQNSNYGYTVVPAAFGSRDLTPVSNSAPALFDEGNVDVPLGFNFNYFGNNYSGVTIHANGQVLMGTGNTSANFQYYPPLSGIPSSDAPNNWVGYWADQYVESAGLITYGVVGSAPNRKLIVRFNSVNYYFSDPSNTFQTELHEGSNEIYVFMTDNSTSSTVPRQIGIEDASGNQGLAAPDRNAGQWTTSNEGWKFAPISFGTPVYTYSWSPATYLNNTNIANPFATAVGGVTEYTVSVTNTTTGCAAAPATIQVLAGVPLTITASSLVNTICAGTTATLVATAGGGGVPYSFEWFVGNTSVGTGASFVVAPEVTTTYTVKVTDVGNSTLESAPFTINVIPLPDVIVTPPGGSICNSNIGVTLTASGNSNSYSWSGDGLSNTFGSVVVANPQFTGLVTVTGTRVSGGIPCTNTATVTIYKAQLGANAKSTPYNICRGEDANLNVTGSDFLQSYLVASLPFSNMDNSPLANPGPEGDEGDVLADLGFSFRFFGNTYTQVTIHANGQILMGNNSSADFQYSPFQFPSTFGPNNWVGYWADMDAWESPETPNITWDVVGSAPNRKFIARWSAVDYYFATPGLSYQIELNETSDLIDVFIVDNNTTNTFSSRIIGLENATGTVGTTPPGRGIGTWVTTNEAWRFSPPLGLFNYSWSPTTFLTNSAIPNPVAQAVNTTIIYTATATDPVSGCSITDTAIVKIIPEPRLDISGPASACAGLTTNLTFNFTGIPPFQYTYTDGITTFGPFVAASNSVTVGVTPPGIAGESFTYTPLSISDAHCQGTGGGSHTVLVVPIPDLTGVTLTSNKPYNLVCSGDNITLSLDGITSKTLGYQGQWKWYRGGCSTSGGGVLVASGVNNIKVSPTANTTYYVRAEGACGNTACLSIPVLVSTNGLNGSPNVTYSPAIAYAGLTDSVVVAPIAGAYYYRWTNGGNSTVLFDGHPAPYTTTSNKVMVTFVSGSTNGNGIGNYHLSFFAANGCGRSNHSNIQIRSSVAAPAVINGPNVACTGQTRTYSIPSITGAKTYEWDLTSGNGTITGQGTTTVTITFTSLPATLCVHGVSAFNSDGPDLCMNITTTILASAAVTGDTLPCPGSSSVYTADSVVGATSYIWTTTVPGASVVGTGRTATVTFPSGSFSGSVCVKANSGCSISPITCRTVVNGAPAPVGTITGPVNGLCAVTSVNFQVPSSGATLYTWAAPAGASIAFGQGTNSVLVDFSSGFAGGSITVIANNACGTTNGALPVSGATLPPSISPSASAACGGESVGYTAAASGATSYAWTVNPTQGTIATTSPNGDFIIVDWITNGGLVSAVATNSCGTSAPANLVTPSGTCRVSGNAVLANVLRASVFPNPTQGQLTLQYNSPEKADYLLKVTDLAGRLIVNKSLSGMQGLNRHELDLSALAKGMYKLSLENASGESIVIKVVIE